MAARLRLNVSIVPPLTTMIGANRTVEINIHEGASVEEIIEKIAELYGEKSKEVMLDNKKMKIKIIVLVDGKHGELKTKLSSESKVVLTMPYAGG